MRLAWYGVAQMDLSMGSLRRDAWMHVHIEAAYEFSDDINLMSRAISGEEYQRNGDFTAGRIASVALWGRALPVHEVRRVRAVSGGARRTLGRATAVLAETDTHGQRERAHDSAEKQPLTLGSMAVRELHGVVGK